MKKILYKIITVCLLVFAAVLATTCQSLMAAVEEPAVSLHSVEVSGINFKGAGLLCKVAIENPNGFTIPLPDIGIKLFLNNNSLLNTAINSRGRLQAREVTIVDVPVSFEYLEAISAITSLKGKTSADYKIALAINFPIPLIRDKVWDFEYQGNIPFPQLPTLSAPSVNVDKIDLTATTIVFAVNAQNPNSFELPPPKINFDYQVNNTSVIKSASTGSALKPNSNTTISMPLTILQAELVKVLGTSILTSRSVNGNLTATFDFGVPSLDPVTLQIPSALPLR